MVDWRDWQKDRRGAELGGEGSEAEAPGGVHLSVWRNASPAMGWRWLVRASGPRYKSGDAPDKDAAKLFAEYVGEQLAKALP